MTAFTVTMSASVHMFGGAPTDKWNSRAWNAFKWGEGTEVIPNTVVMKVNTGALTVTPAAVINYRLVKMLTGQMILSTAAVNYRVYRLISERVAPADQMAHLYIQDANNYFKVFPEQVTDLTLRSTPAWSAVGSTPVAWTTSTTGTTPWS